MSGRGVALCVIAGLFALGAGGLAVSARMLLKGAPGGALVLVAGPSVACVVEALAGMAWYLSGGQVS